MWTKYLRGRGEESYLYLNQLSDYSKMTRVNYLKVSSKLRKYLL